MGLEMAGLDLELHLCLRRGQAGQGLDQSCNWEKYGYDNTLV